MSIARKCDYCGETKDDVKPVLASIAVIGEVYPDQPTGTTNQADSCEACRPVAYEDLFTLSVEQQKLAIPEHRLMKEEEEAQGELRQQIARTPAGKRRAALETSFEENEHKIDLRRRAANAELQKLTGEKSKAIKATVLRNAGRRLAP